MKKHRPHLKRMAIVVITVVGGMLLSHGAYAISLFPTPTPAPALTPGEVKKVTLCDGKVYELASSVLDPSDPDGVSSGLSFPSLVSCNNLLTVDQNRIRQVIGHLSDVLKQRLNDCLKAALDLP